MPFFVFFCSIIFAPFLSSLRLLFLSVNTGMGAAPIHKEYFKAYNRLKARKNRGSLRIDKWDQQVAMIQDWRDAAVRGEMSDAELKQKLDGV